MDNAAYRTWLDARPWTSRWFWGLLALISLVVHYFMGPSVTFPFLFLLPVMLAAWHGGAWIAGGISVGLCLVRFVFWFPWDSPWTLWEAFGQAGVKLLVLIVIAVLTARVGHFQRRLLHQVKTLEGLLPICSYCKRIRDQDQQWKQLETYISARSEASFSHSICPDCLKAQFGDDIATRTLSGIAAESAPRAED